MFKNYKNQLYKNVVKPEKILLVEVNRTLKVPLYYDALFMSDYSYAHYSNHFIKNTIKCNIVLTKNNIFFQEIKALLHSCNAQWGIYYISYNWVLGKQLLNIFEKKKEKKNQYLF